MSILPPEMTESSNTARRIPASRGRRTRAAVSRLVASVLRSSSATTSRIPVARAAVRISAKQARSSSESTVRELPLLPSASDAMSAARDIFGSVFGNTEKSFFPAAAITSSAGIRPHLIIRGAASLPPARHFIADLRLLQSYLILQSWASGVLGQNERSVSYLSAR